MSNPLKPPESAPDYSLSRESLLPQDSTVVGCEVCRWGIKSAEICRLVHFFGSDLQAQILGPTGPMSKTKMRQDLLQYATVDIGMGMPYH